MFKIYLLIILFFIDLNGFAQTIKIQDSLDESLNLKIQEGIGTKAYLMDGNEVIIDEFIKKLIVT